MNNWIDWQGGEDSPVLPDTLVYLQYRDEERDGLECHGPQQAGGVYWDHKGNSADIIAYKLAKSAV